MARYGFGLHALRWAIATICLAMVLWQTPSAQGANIPIRIGILTSAWGPPAALEGMIAGLQELGYREDEDFVAAVWFTEGDTTELDETVVEMLERGVDIVVTVGPLEADAAARATDDHPILFTNVGDPIAQGLVEAYARPGGNITGVADGGFGISGRRLQLFSEMVPTMERVLLPFNIANPHQASEVESYRQLADRLDLTLIPIPFAADGGADMLISLVEQLDIDGILCPRDVDLNIPGVVMEISEAIAIPSMFEISSYVDAGGLASFGSSSDVTGRQVARMIDLILKGQEVSSIPVETPERLEFVINLQTAANIGLAIPQVVLSQANRTIR